MSNKSPLASSSMTSSILGNTRSKWIFLFIAMFAQTEETFVT